MKYNILYFINMNCCLDSQTNEKNITYLLYLYGIKIFPILERYYNEYIRRKIN